MQVYKVKGLDRYIVNVKDINEAFETANNSDIVVDIEDLIPTSYVMPNMFKKCIMDYNTIFNYTNKD